MAHRTRAQREANPTLQRQPTRTSGANETKRVEQPNRPLRAGRRGARSGVEPCSLQAVVNLVAAGTDPRTPTLPRGDGIGGRQSRGALPLPGKSYRCPARGSKGRPITRCKNHGVAKSTPNGHGTVNRHILTETEEKLGSLFPCQDQVA